MSEAPTSAGRVIRAALVIFPLGLALLGAGSFIFYFNHREKMAQRSIKYAAGLRRELNLTDLARYQRVFSEALAKPQGERESALASFMESTMGPENMGYTLRSVVNKGERESLPLGLDAEVTGSQKPRDLVVVMMSCLPELNTVDDLSVSRPAAVFLNLAHSLTGLSQVRSIRFVAMRFADVVPAYYEQLLDPQDRVSHVVLLGPVAGLTDQQVIASLHLEGRGAVILRPTVASGDDAVLLKSAEEIRQRVVDLAQRL